MHSLLPKSTHSASGVFQERILTDHVCRILEHCIELRVVKLLYILCMYVYVYIYVSKTLS